MNPKLFLSFRSNLTTYITKVKNEWSSKSAPLYAFMVWTGPNLLITFDCETHSLCNFLSTAADLYSLLRSAIPVFLKQILHLSLRLKDIFLVKDIKL